MNDAIVSFRNRSAPYAVITSINYSQSALGGNLLPVKEGENSSIVYFRIYNNYNAASTIATMFDLLLTIFDDADPASHTAGKSPVAQSWIRVYETGFGESTVSPGAYTVYYGEDTAIGRSGADSYVPEYGSDGSTTAQIRAGTDDNGVGFLEFATYAQIPVGAGTQNYTLALSLTYSWIT